MVVRWLLAGVLATTLTACLGGVDSDGSDGGGGTDGAVSDAGPDAGSSDGGGSDAGTADAGTDGGAGLTWPSSPETYLPSDLRYLTELTFPPDDGSGGETCCRDFGAISENPGIDNRWGSIVRNLAGFVVDMQPLVDAMLAEGRLLILLDTIDPGFAPEDRIVARLDGAFAAGTTSTEAAAGTGDFLIRRASFLSGSGEPVETFRGTLLADLLEVEGEQLLLRLPLLEATLSFVIRDARLGAIDAGGEYLQGELSGYITLDDFYGSINDYVASPECSCLGLSGPLYQQDASGEWSASCAPDASACTDPAAATCVTLGSSDINGSTTGTCGLLQVLVTGDIDLDGDPSSSEAMSIGLQWAAVPTRSATLEP